MTVRETGPAAGTASGADGARAIRAFLTLDAAASGLLGLLLASLGAAVLKDLLGLPAALLVPAGVFLVVFAGWLRYQATRRTMNAAAIRLVVAANTLWVLASVALVVGGWFALTLIGTTFVLVQAAAVALFVLLQLAGLRRITSAHR